MRNDIITMSEQLETYCRLCAEPTPAELLIAADDEVAVNCTIAAKMLWINIDVSSSNTLPSTICFSCFDLLEKTWKFLQTVRSAQVKLTSLFSKKETDQTKTETKLEGDCNVGKPVNTDWEEFQHTKQEVKEESQVPEVEIEETSIDPRVLLSLNIPVKTETNSDNDAVYNDSIDSESCSTDSDLPLQQTVKKKSRKKHKKFEPVIKDDPDDEVPLDISLLNLSWDDYMCRCASCDAQCKNIASLQLHSLQIHLTCCTFKCSECGKVARNYKSFVSHARMHKKLLKYYCEYCNKQFSMLACVKQHKRTVHRDVYLTCCRNCGATFDTPEQLQDHILIYPKDFKHRKRGKNDCDLKCDDCGKEFKSRSNLQQHKLLHTQRSRDFSCHVCGKMFFTKGTLSTHMTTHEDTKPFKCEFCPMAFRARGNLQSHVTLHSGAKPFVCEQCGKSFRVKRHLKSHSIVHTDLMPYVCEYCNKSFRFKTRLNLHVRQHTGAKPYNCVYCRRDFTNGSNYKKHMKRRHNIDTSKKRYNNIVVDQSADNNGTNDTSQT